MLITRVGAHHLRKTRRPHAIKSYDATSAFHSGKLPDLHEIERKRLRLAQRTAIDADAHDARRARQDETLMRQRRFNAIMTIPCPDGSALLRAREGGLMGDSNEPEMFMGNYHEAIDDYRMDTHNRIAKPMIVTNEWTATTVDASMGSYLGDILRTIVADDGDARTLPWLCDHDATCLDTALEKKGYAQNDTKADITMFAPNNITKQLSFSPTMKGKLLPNLLHLGALIAGSGANGPEVSRLLLNINQAWNFLKHF